MPSQDQQFHNRSPATLMFNRKFSDRQAVDFTSEFFSLGNSRLILKAEVIIGVNCLQNDGAIKGHMIFEINDKFNDVLDFDDVKPGNQEIPGGTPFPIVARWSEALDWSGKFG